MLLAPQNRRFCRWAAGAHSLLFLLSLLGARVHTAMVAHGHCADHAKGVHLHDAEHLASDAGDLDESGGVDTHTEMAAKHHCVVMAFLEQLTLVRGVCNGLDQGPVYEPRAELVLGDVHASIALLNQSPKTSPPQA